MSVVALNAARRLEKDKPKPCLLDTEDPRLKRLQTLLIEISEINRFNPLQWPKYVKLLSQASKVALQLKKN